MLADRVSIVDNVNMEKYFDVHSFYSMVMWMCVRVVIQGVGTAIGELPPYFMARAARLSGQIDEEEQDIKELIQEKDKHRGELVSCDRCQFSHFDNVICLEVTFSM